MHLLLWLILAGLTVAALWAVLRPLTAPARSASDRDGDIAVYRDQLSEIDADLARGAIDAREAENARLEVSRRILRADRAASGDGAVGAASPLHSRLSLAALIALPLAALALYVVTGRPDLPGQPYAARQQGPLEQAPVEVLVARVEAQLRARPEDGRGWDVLAPVYARLGRPDDAADAYRRAIRLLGASLPRQRGLAEALIVLDNGIVREEARGLFEAIAKADPADPVPRFWLIVVKEQDGKLDEAIAGYRELLASAPGDAPWRPHLEERIAALTTGGDARPKTAERGPSASDVAAAQAMPNEDRARMIQGMVDGLAQRLQRDGKDLGGWLRLIQAYSVLGRKGEAKAALESARKNFGGDSKALEELGAAARSLGLGS
jgi:cytochrome c-type biogenesis protein CcmH